MESALNVAADHPAYPGHFPGRPILPGVVLLAEAVAAIAQASGRACDRWSIASAKFLQPVTPGTALTLAHSATPGGGVRFEIRSGDRTVAGGTLVPRG
jgi:3-hydroxymyristoyl/3-hydroxydecanoyl-(acyl carrier protein) dehydratase